MAIFDLFKKKKENSSDSGNHGTTKSEGLRMLEKIRGHLQRDFHDNGEGENGPNAFYRILQKEVKKYVESQAQEHLPVDALPIFYVSADCMRAYTCILPPLNDGKEVGLEQFLEDMRYEGIVSGINNDVITELVESKEYLRIVQIACGEYPKDGIDGMLQERYQRKYAQAPELNEEEMLHGEDFRKRNLIQTIREGEILCQIIPSIPPQNGFDVSGTTLYGNEGAAIHLPQGKYTSISEDGLTLRADISGIVVMEDRNFCIQSQRVLEQDVNASVGSLRFDGDIYIQGNVEDGVTVEATGNVMINGHVRSGKIISGGTICVRGNIKGTSNIELRASKQIQCMIMENVTATAIEDIYASVIANSNVISEKGSVYALMGRGLIFGSNVTSSSSVHAKKIGNISGCINTITLGLESEFERQKAAVNDELDEINRGLEQLRNNITNMQLSGKNHRHDMQEEYNNLLDQRNTYGELKRDKLEELDQLNKSIRSIHAGSIFCQNIYPITEIHIEKYNLTIDEKESDCNIHLQSGEIVLR